MAYEKKTFMKWSGKDSNHEPKRRHLAPLMSDEAKATASIHELSYDFACRITRLFSIMMEQKNILMVEHFPKGIIMVL